MHIGKRINQRKLAKELGIHHVHLNAILKKRTRPSIPLALKIEKYTDGEIKARDLRPDIVDIIRQVVNL